MGAGKIVVLAVGGALAAGLLAANLTTPSVTSYKRAHPASVNDRDTTAQADSPDYADTAYDRGHDGTMQDGSAAGYAANTDDGSDDDPTFGMMEAPSWFAGPEHWLEQRGWIDAPHHSSRDQTPDEAYGYARSRDRGMSGRDDQGPYGNQSALQDPPSHLQDRNDAMADDEAAAPAPRAMTQPASPTQDAAEAAAARARAAAADVLSAQSAQ